MQRTVDKFRSVDTQLFVRCWWHFSLIAHRVIVWTPLFPAILQRINSTGVQQPTYVVLTMVIATSSCSASSTTTTGAKSPDEKPRRNLTHDFEALCVASLETEKEEKSDDVYVVHNDETSKNLISPTSVILDLRLEEDLKLPVLDIHPDLRRELSPECIACVSCYSILHDINKEATALAAHDPLSIGTQESEKSCPLVLTATGQSHAESFHCDPTTVEQAVIDEEKWLLSTIADRKSISGASTICPATFLQAIGEKEYENPVHAVTGHARTQLWKPSRSWWEAKSGKNPWIEPASHNKRWRYLWPLIHYHKFLAKCIKKLKRNGVDVKQSVSPVSVFLREEVCAVSDHLAAVSLFGSEAWMDCLQYFTGWTVQGATEQYRTFVTTLPLRPLQEPGDVDSPVLRNQIDEAFLRTMQTQREQLLDSGNTQMNSTSKSRKQSDLNDASTQAAVSNGPPPTYPGRSPQSAVPRQIHGVRRPRYFPNGGWYQGWDPSYQHQQDNSSVHSELSTNSYPQPAYDPNQPSHYPHHHPSPMYPPPYSYLPHPMYPLHGVPPSDHSNSTGDYTAHDYGVSWMDPAMAAYAMQQQYYHQHHHASPSSPYHLPVAIHDAVPASPDDVDQQHPSTPFKYDPDKVNMNLTSPYWSHLDQATLSMGLATPAKFSPSTPRRPSANTLAEAENEDDEDGEIPMAPLIRQPYYGYGNTAVPPSPATQFMMSPQASFAYNYGYGFSPRRRRNTPKANTNSSLPSTPLKVLDDSARRSPSTVETASESLDQRSAA